MKFETVETWPDKSAEHKALADAVTAAHADGGKSVRVDLDERPCEENQSLEKLPDAELDKLRMALSNQVRKFGRFDVKRDGRYAYVRVSTAAPRTRTAATKKKAAPKAK